MIKRYCDFCADEMTTRNTPAWEGTSLGRLGADITRGQLKVSVEVIHAVNGCWNAGDVCKYCILDALYRLDDRDREMSRPPDPQAPGGTR